MDKKIVVPGRLKGNIVVPASKSESQRALLCAALAEGRSVISGVGSSKDEQAMLGIVRELGRTVEVIDDGVIISGLLKVRAGMKLNAGESGLSSRLIAGVAAGFDVPVTIAGEGSLLLRDMSFWDQVLPQFGVRIESTGGKLPLTIHGPYNSGAGSVDGSASSQYISGLILGLAASRKPFELTVNDLVSKNYLRMTVATMAQFGVLVNWQGNTLSVCNHPHFRASDYRVDSDWSSGSFWLVAAALGHDIGISGLRKDSLQADKAVMEVLKLAGCELTVEQDSIRVHARTLTRFEFDATDCPDLFPILAVLATQCEGTSRILGVKRLANKESDRGRAIVSELTRLGAAVKVVDDELVVQGPTVLTGTEVDAHGDHRMAMSLAIAATIVNGETIISGAKHVAKSYPTFWVDMEGLVCELND